MNFGLGRALSLLRTLKACAWPLGFFGVVLVGAVHSESIPEAPVSDSPEQATKRAMAVKSLRSPGEDGLDELGLLESLGRGWMPRPEGDVTGRVELSLTDRQGAVLAVDGWLSFETDDGKEYGCFPMSLGSGIAPVRGGRASVALRGAERRVTFRSEGLPGYAFASKDAMGRIETRLTRTLPQGESELRVSVPLEPAGAIRWRVLDEAGNPEAARVEYSLSIGDYGEGGSSTPPFGRLLIRPARFYESHRLILRKGSRLVIGDAPLLTSDVPVCDQTIAFVQGETVSGRVLDSFGHPAAAILVELGYQTSGNPNYTDKAASGFTDAEGNFVFEGINFSLPNSYWLSFGSTGTPIGGMAPSVHRVVVPRTSRPLEIRLPVGDGSGVKTP